MRTFLVFEPAMLPDGSLAQIFGLLVGTGPGAGITSLYGITAIFVGLVGVAGYGVYSLRTVEDLTSDWE